MKAGADSIQLRCNFHFKILWRLKELHWLSLAFKVSFFPFKSMMQKLNWGWYIYLFCVWWVILFIFGLRLRGENSNFWHLVVEWINFQLVLWLIINLNIYQIASLYTFSINNNNHLTSLTKIIFISLLWNIFGTSTTKMCMSREVLDKISSQKIKMLLRFILVHPILGHPVFLYI